MTAARSAANTGSTRSSTAARDGGTVALAAHLEHEGQRGGHERGGDGGGQGGGGEAVAAEPEARERAAGAHDGHLDGGQADRVVAVGRLAEDHDVGGEGDRAARA